MKPKSTLHHVLLGAGSSLLAISSAYAGQTWDGTGGDNNWSTPANWNLDGLPNFANQIIFGGTTRTSPFNDLTPDTTIGGFNFTNSATGQTFSISGARITLGGDFTANQFTSVSGYAAANTDTIGIAMILNGNRIFNVGQRRLSNFTGIISETGGARTLTKQGTGGIQFSAANTYSGTTTITTGNILLNNSLGMQNSALDTTNSGNNSLLIKTTAVTLGGLIGNKNFATTAGAGFLSSTIGTHTAASVNALTLNPGTGASHSYSGVIANIAANMTLTKTGAGNQTLTNTNTYTGLTRIDAGTLTLGHATNTLANTGAVNVNGGILALGTNTDTVGAVTLTSGSITGTGAGTLTGTGSAYDVRSGAISAKLGGTVGLTKTTAGTVTISSDNSVGGYTGATLVQEGNLVVNGNITSSSSTTVSSGAILSGTGTLGTLTILNGANLTPGNSAGTLNTGTLSLENLSNINFELDPTSLVVGGGVNDFVNVTGNLTLDGILNLTPTSGDFMSISYGDTWRLFNYSGSLTDNEITFGSMPTLDSGLFWGIDTATLGQVNLVAIPEPSSALLGGLGLLFLLRRRR